MSAEPEPSDLELVRGIKAGDDQAFEQMVDRYHSRVYSLAYGVLRNSEDAEEATQDAFWTLYRKIGTFDESRKFFSWFYRVALNAAYSRARRRPAIPTVAIEEYLPKFRSDGHMLAPDVRDWSVAVEDEVAAKELAARAEGFIAELPPAYRDVIWMYDVEEMPADQIAETLEISIPAFKSRLHRARLYVRQRLSEVTRGAAQEKVAG
jgi:RNA polymerase sigma-70 factor (ECF subfamily)